MKIRKSLNELCWFGALLFVLAVFGFAVVWIDESARYPLWPARDALLLISAGSAVVVVVLMVIAFTLESRRRP